MNYTAWANTSAAHRNYTDASNRCADAFIATSEEPMDTPVAPELGTWTHPGTGEVRRYINNVTDIIGLEVYRYNTGNISSASLGKYGISNCEANRVCAAVGSMKFYLDADGVLQVKRPFHWSPRSITRDEIVDAVKASIAHHITTAA